MRTAAELVVSKSSKIEFISVSESLPLEPSQISVVSDLDNVLKSALPYRCKVGIDAISHAARDNVSRANCS